jgi:hypothetical protein
VAQRTNETGAKTLPDPELNPLLNPLLGAHMGRWAEVYFTNPPEKREEAVAELLRELESGSSAPPVQNSAVQPGGDERIASNGENHPDEELPAPESLPARVESSLICGSCGQQSPRTQKFCGMCGAPLSMFLGARATAAVASEPLAAAGWEPQQHVGRGSGEYAASSRAAFDLDDGNRATRDNGARQPEGSFPSFGMLSAGEPDASTRPRYGLYLGVAIAIVLGVLIYMAWQSNATLGSGAGAPRVQAPAVQEPSPPKVQPIEPNPAPGAADSASAKPPSTSTHESENKLEPGSPTSSPEDRAAEAQPADRAAPAPLRPAAPVTTEAGGAAELGMAEKFLNPPPGVARDSGEAAAWLWKAVAKKNLAATMLLSDLFLRGDGVPKSCDQARYLLDAAARRGEKAAAARIRNLQAFGCQ